MGAISRRFSGLLSSYDLAELNQQAEVIYGIWDDLCLGYINQGWEQFAQSNNGEPAISQSWGLGSCIAGAIPDSLKTFYLDGYRSSINSGSVWKHEFECSSDTSFRRYHQTGYPLGQREGLLIINALVCSIPHDASLRPVCPATEKLYVDANDFIHQCAHCRKIQNLSSTGGWDWVPEWVRHCPENTSHALCPPCLAHYYPI